MSARLLAATAAAFVLVACSSSPVPTANVQSDAATDGAQAEVGETDSGDAATAPDTVQAAETSPPDAAALEEARCAAGAPRLKMVTDSAGLRWCRDGDLSAVYHYSVECSFRKHADGSLRCLPVFGGAPIGWRDSSCASSQWIACGSWSSDEQPTTPVPVIAVVDSADGVRVWKAALVSVDGAQAYSASSAGACSAIPTAPAPCNMLTRLGIVASTLPADEVTADTFALAAL